MMIYMKYLFKSLFAYFLYEEETADRVRERFSNYRSGYGYIDHDELFDKKGIFIDEIKMSKSGGSVSFKTSDRAMLRWQKTPEAKKMYNAAREIVNGK